MKKRKQRQNSVHKPKYAKYGLPFKVTVMLVIVMAAVAIGAIGFVVNMVNTGNINNDTSLRPKYCDENGCIPDAVFQNLPEFPEDFHSKWGLVYYQRITDLDRVEEEYWKQPEFYANSFKDQCMPYYTILEKKDEVPFFSAGSGPYPGTAGARNVSRGQDLEFKSFWHVGCAVARYQIFSLSPTFPDTIKMDMEEVRVNADKNATISCFDIEVDPDYVLLEPNYPIFGYNHTQKVRVRIHVNEQCPIGEYGIHIIPGDPPQDVLEEVEWELGWKLSSMRVGGAWQIYINVEH